MRKYHRAMFWMFLAFITIWVVMHLMYIPKAYGESKYPNLDKVNELSEEKMIEAYTELCESKYETMTGILGCLQNQRTALGGINKILKLSNSIGSSHITEAIIECANENIAPQGVINWVNTLNCASKKLE